MPVGLKGAPECSRSACFKKIYRTDEHGQPLCVTHYREMYDERPLNADTCRSGGEDR